MKYKVIGWTDYGNEEYPENPNPYGNSAWRALVAELREKGYRFGGDSHQYGRGGVPVLNDGTRLEYGMRAWGEAMAEAIYGDDPPHGAYMEYYMDLEQEEFYGRKPVMPAPYVDKSQILPTSALADEYHMKLDPEPFALIKSGKKSVEARLCDQKRSLLDVGDRIIFTDRGSGESIKTEITRLAYADDFAQLAKFCGLARLGCGRGATCARFASDMQKYYSPDDVKKYGVVGIYIALCGN